MIEKNMIRFFDYRRKGHPCFAKYENNNIIVPRVGGIVRLDSELEPYRVDSVTYFYGEDVVMVDVFVSHTNDFFDNNDDECDCHCCCHADVESENNELSEDYNLSDVFTALVDTFAKLKDLNVSVTISDKVGGKESAVYC